jgi:hypothetical protein
MGSDCIALDIGKTKDAYNKINLWQKYHFVNAKGFLSTKAKNSAAIMMPNVLMLVMLSFLHQSQCFVTRSSSSRHTATHQRLSSPLRRGSRLTLLDKNVTDTDEFVFNVADLFGIAVGAQLLGLQDVLSEASFWKDGGWFQPVTLGFGSSVLSELTQRFSVMSAVFLGASWILGPPKVFPDNISILNFAIKIATTYGMIRFLLEFVSAIVLNEEVSLSQTLRETYMIGLATATTRYILNNYIYR